MTNQIVMSRVAIIANTSWYIYNFRLNLIKAILNSGKSVVVIAPKDEYSDKLVAIGCRFQEIKIDSRSKNPFKDLKIIWYFYQILKKEKPVVCLQFTIKPNVYGTIAAASLNIPVINNIAGLGTLFESKSLFTRIAMLLYKYSQSRAAHIFFQNRDDQKLFIENKVVNHNRYSLLPGSGVDLTRFLPVKKIYNSSAPTFILISRLLKAKGIEEYAMAAKKVKEKYPGAVFLLVGFHDPNDALCVKKSDLDNWIQSGYVDFLGKTDDVKKYLCQADCVVLPSYYREGVPRSLLEAAAMGKPIITTDNIGCRETVKDGSNGYLCKIKDSDDLADKIVKFIELPESEKIAMGDNSRKLAEDVYDEKIVLKAYEEKITPFF